MSLLDTIITQYKSLSTLILHRWLEKLRGGAAYSILSKVQNYPELPEQLYHFYLSWREKSPLSAQLHRYLVAAKATIRTYIISILIEPLSDPSCPSLVIIFNLSFSQVFYHICHPSM